MLANFITVIQQVIILTAIITTGFICRKTKMIDDCAINTLTNITLYVAVPCMLIRAFAMEYTGKMLISFFLAMLITFVIHAFSAAVGFGIFRNAPDKKKRVFICCLTFGNIGFMGFPLLSSLYGNMGLFYASAYNLVFNVIMWSVGLPYLDKSTEKVSFLDILLNPSVVGAIIGFLVFITRFRIPAIVDTGMGYLAALAVPLPLMVIGARLTELKPKRLIGDRLFWMDTALRLLIVPVIIAAVLHFLNVRGVLLQVMVIAAATPPASLLGMVAGKNDPDVGVYTAGVVSAETALSMLTIPVVALIVSFFA